MFSNIFHRKKFSPGLSSCALTFSLCFSPQISFTSPIMHDMTRSPIKFSSWRIRLLNFQTQKRMLSSISFHSRFRFLNIFCLTSASVKMRFAATPKDYIPSALLLVFVLLFSPVAKAFKSCFTLPQFIMSSWILLCVGFGSGFVLAHVLPEKT